MENQTRTRRHRDRRRGGVAPLTHLREARLRFGITLAELAGRAGMTTFRASIIERNPAAARPEEMAAHLAAVEAIVTDRGEVLRQTPASSDLATYRAVVAIELAELAR